MASEKSKPGTNWSVGVRSCRCAWPLNLRSATARSFRPSSLNRRAAEVGDPVAREGATAAEAPAPAENRKEEEVAEPVVEDAVQLYVSRIIEWSEPETPHEKLDRHRRNVRRKWRTSKIFLPLEKFVDDPGAQLRAVVVRSIHW